ncbi:ATP-grasp peptide maturase system methyltransferase [Streptomyces sp. CA-253872]|uniref:ATP-grasp peptide maturase system methyltransferase n=1 Tax=Streptomyces sp. CA-253872 TaxID=3240067 RepID=UPI003D8E7355
MTDLRAERHALAERLVEAGAITGPEWRRAVEDVPREEFLSGGVFVPDESGRWSPVLAEGLSPELVYSDRSLVTQLDGTATPETAPVPFTGAPTSSSTQPSVVLDMLRRLDVRDGQSVLEIGTGTGYSTALLCHRLGEDAVTTVEVDRDVARRADEALERVGYSTWTVVGDGLVGHPARAPYDRVVATCAVRRVPYAWVRQTRPGGRILTTLGSWPNGAGLALLTVGEDGAAEGGMVGHSSFMHARSHVPATVAGDLAARLAYPDTRREAEVHPALLLGGDMPALLAQLAAPGSQIVQLAGRGERDHGMVLIDVARESFAEFVPVGTRWAVAQGGPVPLWDRVEKAILAWQQAGRPGVEAVRVRVTREAHQYWIDGHAALSWEDRVA